MELFTTHRPTYMSHLVLSHLSKNNNCPKLVGELFTGCAGGVQIVVASREQETEVYKIEAEPITVLPVATVAKASQLMLF